jgi:two-component system chemotaxis response regulator CheB
MTHRNIIVVGASAGGVEALMHLVAGFQAGLSASIFVVIHFPGNGISALPQILSRSGPLPAHHAQPDEIIQPGQIYIAPPNYHLLIRNHHIYLSAGPRENGHRPAIDPTFRSAARCYQR